MATDTLEIDGEIATVQWTPFGTGTNNWDRISEGTGTPDDTDGVETSTTTNLDKYTFNATAANHNLTSDIDLQFRCGITDATNAAYIRVRLFHTTSTQIGSAQNITCVTSSPGPTEVLNDGTYKTVTLSWSLLSLNKTQMDSLEVHADFFTS